MAPPLTLDLEVSQPSLLLTGDGLMAKVSLASTRSRSATVQPAFSSALREAGIGLPTIAGSIGGRPGLMVASG